MNQHLLVTGGAGFVGSNFVRFVLKQRPDWTVTNIDCLSYCGNRENLADLASDDRYRFVHGDICNPRQVESLVGECDTIVHFAAESHVDRSIADPQPFLRTNVLGTDILLDAARRVGDRRILLVSTDEVYGSLPRDRPDLKFTEETALHPNSPYAASKAAGDLLAQAYHNTFALPVIVTRCCNNFGPYQFPEKVIPLFVTNLLEGSKVPLYGDGRHVREWIHVDDHCSAVLAVLERGRPGEIYNIGSGIEQSNRDLTGTILKAMGKDDTWIEPVADRPGHDARYAVDNTKLIRELGWRPTCSSWPETLEQTVRWYVDHPEWWQPLKSRNAM